MFLKPVYFQMSILRNSDIDSFPVCPLLRDGKPFQHSIADDWLQYHFGVSEFSKLLIQYFTNNCSEILFQMNNVKIDCHWHY